MLAPEVGSTNTDPPSASDKAPLVTNQIYRRISGIFSSTRNARSSSQGYVEFGSITEPSETRTLGTFAGVFSPVALSMFSALIFLRMGYIVGNAGLYITLVQFLIAYAILLFTVASVCAISTNGAVEGGGAYFMISRTLGPDFGGSIGTLFFLANVVNSALNISGCAEGLVENFGPSGYLIGQGGWYLPDGHWYRFLYCTALNILNLLVCLIGAGMFAKTSVVILAVVSFCLGTTFLSYFIQPAQDVAIPDTNTLVQNATNHVIGRYTGLLTSTLDSNLWPSYAKDYTTNNNELVNFASVFGVLFSGVTGIMAGANMSGELKNPSKNIPYGTLSAVLFTFITYITVSILTAATCTTFLLHNNYLFMIAINFWPVCVAIGLVTATLSASLSNLIGSSRVLEALAKDQVFGSFLDFITKGTWRGNPLAAVFTSWFLVQIILLIGSLNTIAQINSVLFLLSYLATNMACLGLDLASAPNFRPTFKYFSWHTALLGLIGTFVMMFVINPVYAACSIVLCLVLIVFLHLFSSSKEAHWGSISQALIFHQVRKYLLMLDSRKDHVKFWRPQILLMISNPRTSSPLIDFINDLKKGGLYVLGHVKIGNTTGNFQDPTIPEYTHWLSLVDHLKVKAFIELTVANTVREGFQHLVRISGMGAMKPNTIVLGFHDAEQGFDFFQSENSPYYTQIFESSLVLFPLRNASQKRIVSAHEYVCMIGDTLRMNKNICLCRNFNRLDKKVVAKNSKIKYIDVWPINFFQPGEQDMFDTSSLFMMQLACIVNMVPTWKRLQLRICLCDDARTTSFQVTSNESRENLATDVKLKQLLNLLRITASIYPINSWPGVVDHLRGRSVVYAREQETDNSASFDDINRTYLTSVNSLIRQHSENTAVTFIYLPSPPAIRIEDEEMIYPQYLQMLSDITESLPPTILVHGINTVTSTSL